MADIYQRFLASPSESLLTSNAALHYITTTSSIREPAAIVKHLQAQSKLVEKKSEVVLSSTESSNSVVLETETTLKFVRSGGLILPQMDDNMLADMTAVCPMIHIVQLEGGKISQIRLHWDQGTMLKQVEAIGKTGRNWPIRDGNMQTQMIKDSVKASGQASVQASQGAPANGAANGAPKSQSQASNGNGRMESSFNDRLFATGQDEEPKKPSAEPGVARVASAKPAERQYGELFAGDFQSQKVSQNVRSSQTPALKTGAGTGNVYERNRLFDHDDTTERQQSPGRKQADPAKFNHFELGNGEDTFARASDKPSSSKAVSKQTNDWDFHDYVTPEKIAPRANREQERHFGYGIDEEPLPTPPKRPIVHAPRPDQNPHFKIADTNSPASLPLRNVTSTINNTRRADMAPHFDIHDNSPAGTKQAFQAEHHDPNARGVQKKDADGPKASKARNDMESHWGFGSEETPIKKIYKTAGDGMGGRAGSRNWALGDDGENADNTYGQGGQKQIYKTQGNGMGGRKDTGRGWAIGDDEGF